MNTEVNVESETSWEMLPQHLLVSVFEYLSPSNRLNAALTCKTWHNCLKHPLLWRRFTCRFTLPVHEKVLMPIEEHGHRIRSLVVELDQEDAENRKRACQALHSIAVNTQRRLSSLTVHFLGQNPLFYAGAEFITELKILFGHHGDSTEPYSLLTEVDLTGLDVAFDNTLFDTLSENHPQLQYLDIQNKSLVCKVSPDCMVRFVSRCTKLKDLRVFHLSINDEVLTALAEPKQPALQRLSIIFRRETKYTYDLSSEAWSTLVKKVPNLRVTLGFDHTCPLNRISEVMKAEIPVTVLRLETFTRIYDEVNQAVTFYHKTLEKVVLQTRNSEELQRALIRMAETCPNMRCLKVYCVLSEETVERILDLLPVMRRSGNYILKSQMQEGPWVVGVETDEEAHGRLGAPK